MKADKTDRTMQMNPRPRRGLSDITEEEIREVLEPLPPAVIWREVDDARNFYERICKLDEECFAATGKRAQIFAGVWHPDLLCRRDHQLDRIDEVRAAVARILAEKGMLDELARRRPFWYGDLARLFCFRARQERATKKEVFA